MYTIGQLACLEGVTPKTLRHYEKLELLMPSAHSDSGYRLYSEEDRQKLHEILYYRDLGFPLKAVGEMLRSAEGERRELIEEQISHLGNTIRRCENLRTELLDIREKEKGHGEKNGAPDRGHAAGLSGKLAAEHAPHRAGGGEYPKAP